MPLPNITLAQFNAISNGDYNAGQIDFATGRNGETELVKNTAADTSSYRIDIGVQPSFAGCAPRAILI